VLICTKVALLHSIPLQEGVQPRNTLATWLKHFLAYIHCSTILVPFQTLHSAPVMVGFIAFSSASVGSSHLLLFSPGCGTIVTSSR
jgi:hypothetical protein